MDKDIIKEAIREMLADEKDRQLFGNMIVQAVNVAMRRDIRFEDGKSEPGRVVEKTETWNLLDWLVKYLPMIEAAIRGCQADSAGARNRATETRDSMQDMAGRMQQLLSGLAVNDPAIAYHLACPRCDRAVPIPADGHHRQGVRCGECGHWVALAQTAGGAIEMNLG
jgi:hypothetical protein